MIEFLIVIACAATTEYIRRRAQKRSYDRIESRMEQKVRHWYIEDRNRRENRR